MRRRAGLHRSDAASPPSAPAHRAARDSEFRVPRGDVVPALRASAPSGAWRPQAGTRPQSESMRGRSVCPAGSTPRKWPCESDRREPGTRDWHWRLHTQSHNHTVMIYQERRNSISNCGLARYQLIRLRSRQRHDGQIRDELRLTQPEILRFSRSAQSPSHSSSLDQGEKLASRQEIEHCRDARFSVRTRYRSRITSELPVIRAPSPLGDRADHFTSLVSRRARRFGPSRQFPPPNFWNAAFQDTASSRGRALFYSSRRAAMNLTRIARRPGV